MFYDALKDEIKNNAQCVGARPSRRVTEHEKHGRVALKLFWALGISMSDADVRRHISFWTSHMASRACFCDRKYPPRQHSFSSFITLTTKKGATRATVLPRVSLVL
jgi:hypothetical protein